MDNQTESWALQALSNPKEAPLMEAGENFALLRAELWQAALSLPNKMPALAVFVGRHEADVQEMIYAPLDETRQENLTDYEAFKAVKRTSGSRRKL